jgi:hypothetical protein
MRPHYLRASHSSQPKQPYNSARVGLLRLSEPVPSAGSMVNATSWRERPTNRIPAPKPASQNAPMCPATGSTQTTWSTARALPDELAVGLLGRTVRRGSPGRLDLHRNTGQRTELLATVAKKWSLTTAPLSVTVDSSPSATPGERCGQFDLGERFYVGRPPTTPPFALVACSPGSPRDRGLPGELIAGSQERHHVELRLSGQPAS